MKKFINEEPSEDENQTSKRFVSGYIENVFPEEIPLKLKL